MKEWLTEDQADSSWTQMHSPPGSIRMHSFLWSSCYFSFWEVFGMISLHTYVHWYSHTCMYVWSRRVQACISSQGCREVLHNDKVHFSYFCRVIATVFKEWYEDILCDGKEMRGKAQTKERDGRNLEDLTLAKTCPEMRASTSACMHLLRYAELF